jgi:ectoine hydroxylase-related dioxygenase (phytanoyl-CoA dioxygenase family)
MYLPVPYKVQYDTQKFPFKEIVESILEVDNLSELHKLKDYLFFSREMDQSTDWHKAYYSKFSELFYPTYVELVKELANSFEYESIIYQKIPTFRTQLVNNLAVGEWHRDRAYNHGTSEVNFWMPFTDTNETNTLWMESSEGKEDFMPYTVKYGEILVFNGANLLHGNKTNTSDSTRVSVDFRLVDPAKFIPTKAGSINMNSSFEVGGYFEKL